MASQEQQQRAAERLDQLIESFDTAMLITSAPDRSLHARPMHIVDHEGGGRLWFVTGWDTPKRADIQANPQVAVALQGVGRYLSITGLMSFHADPERIRKLWSEEWRIWFPEGKDDPDILLMRLQPQTAEFWDMRAPDQLRYLLGAGAPVLQGRAALDEQAEHEQGHANIDLR